MKYLVAALLIALPVAGRAEEDAEHRADRLRTEQLNRDEDRAVARRKRGSAFGNDQYRAAREAYAREMQAWRRRVSACESGDYSACERR